MWRQIGIKDYSSDRSLSQVSNGSSERRYRRRRPYNESDSIDHVQNQFSRIDYFDEKEKEKEALESKISSKKDKQLIPFLDKNQEFRKTGSLLKINSQGSDQMYNSVQVNNLFRSGSLKAHYHGESLTNLKHRKESDSIPRLNESLVVEQQGLYQQINRLNFQLQKQKRVNAFLREKLGEFKKLHQEIDIDIKESLYQYYQIQKNLFMEVQTIFDRISFRAQCRYAPQTMSTSNSVPQLHCTDNLDMLRSTPEGTKNSSISMILGVIEQMKNRILQKTIIQVSTPKSSHGGCYSPRSDKKRTVLPSVAEFEELMNR